MAIFDPVLAALEAHPWLLTALQIVALALVVWFANTVTRSLLVRGITRAINLAPARWDSALLGRGVIARLANIAPALVAYYGITFVQGLPEGVVLVVRDRKSVV